MSIDVNLHDTDPYQVDSNDCSKTDDVFVARQPVVDQHGRLVAYELVCRNAVDAMAVTDDAFLCSAAVVVRAIVSGGLDTLIGKFDAHLQCPIEFFTSDAIEALPADRFVIGIPAKVILNNVVASSLTRLRKLGFRLALNDVYEITLEVEALLPYMNIVKVSSPLVAPLQLPALVDYCRQSARKVVADKIEGRPEHAAALAAGCDFIQGYYFSKPQLIAGKKAMPTAALVLRVLQLLLDDADHDTIAKALRDTPLLVTQLLRLANSGSQAQANGKKILSIRQALSIAGTRRLTHWCCLILYTNPDGLPIEDDPLVALAQRRADLMSKISRMVRVSDLRFEETAFLTGMLSLLHVVYGIDVRRFLDELPLDDAIKNGIAYGEGDLGSLLQIAEQFEHGEVRKALSRLDTLLDGAPFGSGFLRSLMPASPVVSD